MPKAKLKCQDCEYLYYKYKKYSQLYGCDETGRTFSIKTRNKPPVTAEQIDLAMENLLLICPLKEK